MKLKLAILILFLLPSMIGGQRLEPVTTPVASWALQSITITRSPLHIISITMYNVTGTGIVTVSYPCETGTCATDTDAATDTLIATLFSNDYTTDNFMTQLFTMMITDFSFFSGMSVS